jgi:hypothetical protein
MGAEERGVGEAFPAYENFTDQYICPDAAQREAVHR